jgi:hypothetical protein
VSAVIVSTTECCLLENHVTGLAGGEAARAAAVTLLFCLENKLFTFGGVLGVRPALPLLAITLLRLVAMPWPNTKASRRKRTFFGDRTLAEVVRVKLGLP